MSRHDTLMQRDLKYLNTHCYVLINRINQIMGVYQKSSDAIRYLLMAPIDSKILITLINQIPIELVDHTYNNVIGTLHFNQNRQLIYHRNLTGDSEIIDPITQYIDPMYIPEQKAPTITNYNQYYQKTQIYLNHLILEQFDRLYMHINQTINIKKLKGLDIDNSSIDKLNQLYQEIDINLLDNKKIEDKISILQKIEQLEAQNNKEIFSLNTLHSV